jgi:hypothetical protein
MACIKIESSDLATGKKKQKNLWISSQPTEIKLSKRHGGIA